MGRRSDTAYTEGVRYVAEAGGATSVACARHLLLAVDPDRQRFAVGGIPTVDAYSGKGPDCRLVCQADSKANRLVEQQIEFTDFPLDSITIYLIGGVMLLSSEY